MTTTKWSA